MIAALAGGVGAARFLRGLLALQPANEIVVVGNTGDDLVISGLTICPDLDTLTYTLAGAGNTETGWGLAGESFRAMGSLERYGGMSWFRLGDLDLGTHLYRSQRLAEGATLSQVTTEIARAWGLQLALLPMSDRPAPTRVTLADGEEVGFQDYFVRLRHDVAVSGIKFSGASNAAPAPGVVEALQRSELVVICPSNPIVSIGPIRAIAAIEEALLARRSSIVAISPIVAGQAIKGPAARMLSELGHLPSVVGVARIYAPIASTLVIDTADAALAPAVEAEGVRCVVAETVMEDLSIAAALARTVTAAGGLVVEGTS